MSYFIIGRRPINDTMETPSAREMPRGSSAPQPDTRLLEAAQRQLDTLRASMDARLGELEVALSNPSQAASLPALVMELSRLATSEAHATAARICMQLRHDNEAALLGGIYVLEGSRMGAAVLASAVPAAFPHQFLSVRPPAGHWAAIIATLERKLYSSVQLHNAKAAALRTFACFEQAAGI